MEIGLVTASFVAREGGYAMEPFMWGKAERMTREAFSGENFTEQFTELMEHIHGLGYRNVEIWNPHLPVTLSPSQVETAKDILESLGMHAVSYYFSVGGDMSDEFVESGFRTAKALGVDFIVGVLDGRQRHLAKRLCHRFEMKMALENHSEKTARELIDAIGSDGDCFGVTCDTGWWGTYETDAVAAVRELAPYLLHMHLKDVKEAGKHDSCRFLAGVVPVDDVVRELVSQGYQGCIGIEHEPEHFDPSEDLEASRILVESWLQGNFGGETSFVNRQR
jgi:L-ribulose-5-phosphate 3-epimerase